MLRDAGSDGWLVRFLDEPEVGEEKLVRSQTIVIAWEDSDALLREEAASRRLDEATALEYPGDDHPLTLASNLVFAAAGEDIDVWGGRGQGPYDAFTRVAGRCGVDAPKPDDLCYVDGDQNLNVPFSAAVTLAKALANREARTVQLYIDAEERKVDDEIERPGSEHMVSYLAAKRPAFALAREWAGLDPAIQSPSKEIDRLHRVIESAVKDLNSSSDEMARLVAARMRAALAESQVTRPVSNINLDAISTNRRRRSS